MFTGLVQAIGTVRSRGRRGNVVEFSIESASLTPELSIGDSVAVSGVCLTATRLSEKAFGVDVAQESLGRTTFESLDIGHAVNLELPLRATDRLGGHFVQGHVDEVGRVSFAGERGENHILRIEHSTTSAPLVVEKGSVAIDGVSLTVTAADADGFEVMLIPHTLDVTTLSSLRAGDGVNLEYDILAKYMLRFADAYVGGRTGNS